MKKVSRFFEIFLVLAFSAIVCVTLVQVFMRYVLDSPLKWAEELSRYIFVWAIMISVAVGGISEAHIRLNMVTTQFGKRAQLFFFMLGQVIIAAFNVVLIVWGGRLALDNMTVPSPAMQIPIGIAYAGIPVGAVIVLVFLVFEAVIEVQKYKESDLRGD